MRSLCPAGIFTTSHKFRPRYDVSAAKSILEVCGPGWFYMMSSEREKAVEASRSKTYVYDICIRCGETVKRNG